jgi:hypothetical protein
MTRIISNHSQQWGPTYLSGYQEHTPNVNREPLIYPSVNLSPASPCATWSPGCRESDRALLLPKSRPIPEEGRSCLSQPMSRAPNMKGNPSRPFPVLAGVDIRINFILISTICAIKATSIVANTVPPFAANR